VCVDASPFADRLIHIGRGVATTLDADLVVLHIGTNDVRGGSAIERQRLDDSFELARSLGARVVTLPSRSVANAIAAYVRGHNVVKIIVGRSSQPALLRALRPSVADRLARRVGSVDLYVISKGGTEAVVAAAERLRNRRWIQPVLSVAIMGAVTAIALPMRALLSPANLVMAYLMAAVVIALRWGQGAAITGSVAGALFFDFSFVPPYFTFSVTDLQYVLALLGLLAVSLVTSALAGQVKAQADSAAEREAHTAVLYSLSRGLAGTRTAEQVFNAIEHHLRETFHRHAAIWVSDNGTLTLRLRSPEFDMRDECPASAVQVFETSRPSGVEPPIETRYYPLVTSSGSVGVLGLQSTDLTRPMSVPELRLLEAVAAQAASAIERESLADQARRARLLEETDRLQQALLNSISHNLRTPLASITGVLSGLAEDSARLEQSAREDLLATAREEAERLNRFVGNLLDMTRLEARAMRIHIEPCDVQDVIGAALRQLGDQGRKRSVAIDAPASLPLVPMDFVLISQALVNVLDNAVKYSPPDAPIVVRAEVHDHDLEIVVIDRGRGIPRADLDRIFDKFYRGHQTGIIGNGLGLSISRGFVEAHGGRIHAESAPRGGTVIRFTLPLGKAEDQTCNDRKRDQNSGRR
jgi:two-component system sensor histidine kinase KdpD